MSQLSGKVVLVTGAGSGIGRASAQTMAARGATVVINDINDGRAQETVELIRSTSGAALACVADVSSAAAVKEGFQRAASQVGPIDILINNAGIASGRLALDELQEDVVDRMLAVNVKGAIFCTQAVLPSMKQRRSGKIINVSSIMGLSGQRRGSHYAAAKGALLSLTKAWAKELAEWNIQVNAVAPGRVRTPMVQYMTGDPAYKLDLERSVPLKRQAEPDEIAYLIAFLASSESDYITGQIVSPNGGESI